MLAEAQWPAGHASLVKGAVLEAHGLFTWADTSKSCYENTLDIINRATAWLADKSRGKRPFGAVTTAALTIDRRREIAAGIMPTIRGLISTAAEGLNATLKVGHFDDSETVLDFVGGEKLAGLAALGTSCPDHFLRTKIWPLVLPFDPVRDSVDQLAARVKPAIEAYRERYKGYYERCKRPDSPKMRDANPVVYLVPGVGMITFAADKATDPAVKSFATMLVDQHSAANAELKALAAMRDVKLPDAVPADKKQLIDKLAKKTGATFDQAFVKQVGLKDHEEDIKLFESASQDTKDQQLKAWIDKTLPTLKSHLAAAQKLPGAS